MHYLTSV